MRFDKYAEKEFSFFSRYYFYQYHHVNIIDDDAVRLVVNLFSMGGIDVAIHKSLVNLFIITILNISWVVMDAVLYFGVKIASVYANVPFTLTATSNRT